MKDGAHDLAISRVSAIPKPVMNPASWILILVGKSTGRRSLLLAVTTIGLRTATVSPFWCNDARSNAKAEHQAEKIGLLQINFFD
jgi:hypothetical protein